MNEPQQERPPTLPLLEAAHKRLADISAQNAQPPKPNRRERRVQAALARKKA